jgi:dihydrofolate reductase
MRKVVVTEFLTLDGVMEAPNEWSFPYWSDEAGQFKYDELFASDALLLGRVTYEGFAAAWPSMTDEQGFADRMNRIAKYVVSTTLNKAEWNNSTIISANVPEELARLKALPGQDILVGGSAQLIQTLIAHDLVDTYRLLVYPLVRGTGKRLFLDGTAASLQLVEAKPFSSGVVALTYQPARKAGS